MYTSSAILDVILTFFKTSFIAFTINRQNSPESNLPEEIGNFFEQSHVKTDNSRMDVTINRYKSMDYGLKIATIILYMTKLF